MPSPNVGERDARLRQVVAGAGFLFAVRHWRHRPVVAIAATVAAVDLAVTAAARWCWANELLGVDTRAWDGAPSVRAPPERPWGESHLLQPHPRVRA